MTLGTQRLDHFLAKYCKISKGDVRLLLAKNRVYVDGKLAQGIDQRVNQFSQISLDDREIQNNPAYYVMLHKPVGVVCATKDNIHPTVIDILPFEFKHELHIVGRLDLNTSGLVLLTNDSRWSEAITQPKQKVEKTYQVTLQNPVEESYVCGFKQGMYFEFENITTLPANLTVTGQYSAEVKLVEGKYHQVKRMFGRYRNPVIKLHRSQIGELKLDEQLAAGQSRHMTKLEIDAFKN
ncbi:pseudouridine synthase [Thalassotalea fusca]